MHTPDELAAFLDRGYLHVPGALDADEIEELRRAFTAAGGERAWKVSQPDVLKERAFIALIEHPAILGRMRALFGDWTQLLSIDTLYQGPRSSSPERGWHRDFWMPGDVPLSVNTIVYLDDMVAERGPTAVIPGSQRGVSTMPDDRLDQRHPAEIEVPARAGDLVFINSALWHSGGRNRSDGPRRALYAYYGWWWLKRYDLERPLPGECLVGASPQRLRLLGLDQPQYDLHLFPRSGTVFDTLAQVPIPG